MQLTSIHYDKFELSVNRFEPIEFRPSFHNWDEGHICALCGIWYGDINDLRNHLTTTHSEWFKAVWLTLKQCSALEIYIKNIPERIELFFKRNIAEFSTKLMRVSDMFDNIYKDEFELKLIDGEYGREHFVCKTCGEEFAQKHAAARHVPRCKEKQKRASKWRRYVHPLKPWDDPESLFCSPNLKNIIDKEPLAGKECKDNNIGEL